MASDERLGSEQQALLQSGARLSYRETGTGPAVLFVHGVLTNGDLWRDVVPVVARAGRRCVTVDLPLGSHRLPMPRGSDLSPPGIADLLEDFIEALDLEDVTVVANDAGGAIVQILMTKRPARIGRVALTSSDSFERFPPTLFRYLPLLGALPGGPWLMAQVLRVRWVRRLPIAFGWATKRPLPDDIVRSFLEPARASRAVRRDLAVFLRGVHRRYTLTAAERLHTFDRPVLLAWSREDRLFPLELAHRLAGVLPQAQVVPIDDAYAFSPLDRPECVAALVTEFVTETVEPAGAGA